MNRINFRLTTLFINGVLVLSAWRGSPSMADGGAKTTIQKNIQAIELRQNHRYFGDVQLILSAVGLRMTSYSQKFVVVSKAPDWNFSVFRDDDKVIFEESFADFLDRGLISGIFMSTHDSIFVTKLPQGERKVNIKGFNALRLINEKKEIFEYIPADQNCTSKGIELLHALYKTPTNHGIPLLFSIIAHGKEATSGRSVEGNLVRYLSTGDIKSVRIDPNIFDAPARYKKVKFVGDVTVSNKSRREASDFTKMLDH